MQLRLFLLLLENESTRGPGVADSLTVHILVSPGLCKGVMVCSSQDTITLYTYISILVL